MPLPPPQAVPSRFFEPQRMAAILVIFMVSAEFMIPGLAIHIDGTTVLLMDFEPQKCASACPGDLLHGGDQGRSDAAAGMLGSDGKRVKTCKPAPRAKQHKCNPHNRVCRLRHQGCGARRSQQAGEASARHPVGFEDPVFEVPKRIEIRGRAGADVETG